MSVDFSDIEFSNTSSRCPTMVIIDSSSSQGQPNANGEIPLDSLNDGLDVLITELHKDPLARKRVDLSFVVYGTHVSEPTPFANVDDIILPTLVPSGTTSTGQAIVTALDALEARKQEYKDNGVTYYRPFILFITDGLATDDITEAHNRIVDGEKNSKFSFYAVGVDGYDHQSLSKLVEGTNRPPLPLKGLKFDELFMWLSASMANISASTMGEKASLPSPDGWADF